MNKLDLDYQNLLEDILTNGTYKQTRNGKTISVFGRQIRHNMSEGFPALTTKKLAFKTMVKELLWFLRGSTRGDELTRQGCHIWDGDMFANYIKVETDRTERTGQTWTPLTIDEFIKKIKTDDKFAKKWGDLGPIYGKQWRSWTEKSFTDILNRKISYYGNTEAAYEMAYEEYKNSSIDQIQNLINELKINPDSRRLMVSAWNVGELHEMILPPCHFSFQCYSRELSKGERMDYWFKNNKPNRDVCDSVDESSEEEQHKYFDGANVPKRAISLMWNQRSVDTFLGLPFNIASYGLLLEIIAKEVNMIPDELIGNLGDVHLYKNHIEQAKEQLTREPMRLPTLKMSSGHNFRAALKGKTDEIDLNDFILLGYDPHPTIKAPLSN